MSVYIAIILQVTAWLMDSAPALKYTGRRLESWLAGHLEKGIARWRGETRYVNVLGDFVSVLSIQNGRAILNLASKLS